jgi:hypothetical protein
MREVRFPLRLVTWCWRRGDVLLTGAVWLSVPLIVFWDSAVSPVARPAWDGADRALSWAGWQGIAGFAQIGAAAVSIWAIRLALQTMRQGEEALRLQREQALDFVRPVWEMHSVFTEHEAQFLAPGEVQAQIIYLNMGGGPALRTSYDYTAYLGPSPKGIFEIPSVVGVGYSQRFDLTWDTAERAVGVMRIRCWARSGEHCIWPVVVQLHPSETEPQERRAWTEARLLGPGESLSLEGVPTLDYAELVREG